MQWRAVPMLIDIPVFIGRNPTGPNEGRILVESLRCYLDSLHEHKDDEPDPAHIRAIADFALTILDGVLTHTEQLDTGYERDEKGNHQTIYRPVAISQVNPQNGAGEGKGV